MNIRVTQFADGPLSGPAFLVRPQFVGHTSLWLGGHQRRMGKKQNGRAGLRIRLYGPPLIDCPGKPALSGQRTIALLALLATAPNLQRTRTWLTAHLWSDLESPRARANLRQLLHALRQTIGEGFDTLFTVTRDVVGLNPEMVTILGSPVDGAFLEGLDLGDESFEEWLREIRQAQPETPSGSQAKHCISTDSRILSDPEPLEELLSRISVRPFAELAAHDGLGDAIAQELTTHFARSQIIDAISHYSSRSDAMAQDAGNLADYAVTGTCRLSGTRIILDASLVDLNSGKVLWADRQRGDLAAFLAGEDEMTAQLAGQMIRVLLSRSIAETSSKPLPELPAHMLMVAAVGRMHSFEPRHFELAQAQLQEVIARCPDQSLPRAWLAQWHLLRIYQKWTDQPKDDRQKAQDAIRNALDLNANCALSLAIDGNIHTILLNDFDTARRRFEAARAINPSSAFISQIESVLATFADDGARAIDLTDRAFRLSPRDPRRPFFQTLSAGSYVAGGRYLEAVEMAETSIRHHPQHLSAHRCRVIGLQLAGRADDARKAARELMQRDPTLRVSDYIRGHPAGESANVRKWAEALREAGVPMA
jgi:TolB-like protein